MSRIDRFDSLFNYYAAEWQPGVHLDPLLLKAQALAESNMDPTAVSRAGAQGLTQFMPQTFVEVMGNADPFNPEHSIRAQCVYMGRLLRRFDGNTAKALAAYNFGQGALSRVLTAHGEDWLAHCPQETQAYVTRVLALWHGFTMAGQRI